MQNAGWKAPEEALEVSRGSSESNLIPINYLYLPPRSNCPNAHIACGLCYGPPNQNKGRNADRHKAQATRDEAATLNSGLGGRGGGEVVAGPREGPVVLPCSLGGGMVPFFQLSTIGSTGDGRQRNKTL